MCIKIWKLEMISVFLVICYISSISAHNLSPSNQPEAYFNGSAYLRVQTTISLKKVTGLSFRTCSGGTLFKQQQSDDYFELLVNSEAVLFSAKTAGKQFSVKIQGNFLNNKWHLVVLEYELGNLTLRVDNERRLIANGSYQNELLTSPSLYNEGASVLLVGKQYSGCLMEGPGLVFDKSNILSNHNVIFETCPIPDDSCIPKENLKDNNSCIVEPCMRRGTCHNTQNGYTCSCLPRYTGKNCEFDLGNPCDKIPPVCKNAATCNADSTGEYTCFCPPNFTGRQCEQEVIVHPQCHLNPCKNGGTCTYNNGDIQCLCMDGFIGARCESNVDECKPNPCKNGGGCHDGSNNFTCDCSQTGYTGRLCDVNINECLTNPCLNHGTCFDTYGTFLCQCPPGFAGSHCQNSLHECMSQPCLNHGICVDNPDGFTCQCPPSFGGERCEEETRQMSSCEGPNCHVDICLNNPCKNGGLCTQINGYFNCSCQSGFVGKLCETKTDNCLSQPCLNGGICIEQHYGITCNCTDQWMGQFCETPYDACAAIKPCKNNATCITLPNKYEFTCKCLPGYDGNYCENDINDCIGVSCAPGKICVDLINDYECRCPLGYSGENCSLDSDPCAREPCLNDGICKIRDDKSGFSCQCPHNFTGDTCEKDVDECAQHQKICNNGICQNLIGSFQCYCKPGFTGERCNLDFDECLSTPCKNGAKCHNLINNYQCECPPGYTGKDCSIDINECEPMPCQNGGTCRDGINSFTCECPLGFDGETCHNNIDDCESSPCKNDAQCIDGLNAFTCNCTDTGYTGETCEINIDDCVDNPCQNGAECHDKVKDYECTCYSGYTGKNCDLDINECDSSPCKYNGTCLERSNQSLYNSNSPLPEIFNRPFKYENAAGYECLCVEGVTGENCEIDINECESSPCIDGTCIDKIGGFYCECDEGFEGEFCNIDIDECERYKPCVHGRCLDKRASYYCDCDLNFGGKNCSVELTGCDSDPCLNNGMCKPYLIDENIHRFNCSCPNGFHGHVCEKITTMSLSGKSTITINTAREEGYDIQFRFKTTLGDGLLALGKGLTFYILELSRGRLNLHSSLLNKWEGVFIGSNLNDSQWQRVFVAINSTHLVLSANDEQTIYPISFNENSNGTTYTSFPVTYIGGIPSNLKKLTHGQPFLVGCTEDVLINGEWILPEDSVPYVKYDQVDVSCKRQPQCNPNPCHSGGHCTDLWLDFRCTCGRPYLGHTCQYNYTAATFGYENITNSLVTVNVDPVARRAVRTIVDISMFIRTRQSRGQIFYLGSLPKSKNLADETYIAAQLEGGELLVRIQFNGTPEAYTVGGVKLDNGYDHLIEVIRNITLVQVKLNGTEYFRKTISATGTIDAQVLFLGGPPQSRPTRQANDNYISPDTIAPTASAVIAASSLSNVHFKGIIQDVQISNGSSTMVVEFFPLNAEELEIPMSFGDVQFDNTTVLDGVRSDNSCKVNPCLHNGVCENTWNDYRCICTRGFKGKDCSDLEFCEIEKCPLSSVCKNLEDGSECVANATFDGKQQPLEYHRVVWLNSTKSVTYDTLELTYRSRSWGTLFFAKYVDDFFAIFIYYNEVVVQWRIGKMNEMRTRFRKDRFEGQWLTLFFEYKKSVFKGGFKDMVMDENPNMKATDFDIHGFTEILKNGVVYIGGSDGNSFDYQEVIDSSDFNMTGYIPVSDTTTAMSITSNSLEIDDSSEFLLYKVDQNKTSDRFKGCVNEVRIGGLLLPFFTSDQLSLKNHYFELSPEAKPEIGCILCYATDCHHEGTCINPTDTYKCDCLKGYTADDCSIDINECENNRCENNATCEDRVGYYECRCEQGFEGKYCEEDIDECLSNPCRHGGTCNNGIGTFKCECPEGYAGKQCEAPILITCDNKPCKEGATCVTGANANTGNNFTCHCTEGMEGPLCDTPFCLRQHCENGSCNTTFEIPYCQCIRGFEGKFCEINIDDCVAPTGESPCQNGGICHDGVNRFDCDCSDTGYRGLLCELDIDECETDKNACGSQGVCENLPGSYWCTCEDSHKCGHHCQLDNPCEVVKPCVEGICVPSCTKTADYICKCNDNYTGKNCSDYKVAASHMDSINVLYIVIPIVLLVSVGIAIGLAVLVNIARSKRATRGTYSPSAQEFCNPRVELDHVLKPPPEERLI